MQLGVCSGNIALKESLILYVLCLYVIVFDWPDVGTSTLKAKQTEE